MATFDAKDSSKRAKLCFVTVGATAPFDALIKAILDPAFLCALRAAGYTDLRVQHGHTGDDHVFSNTLGKADISRLLEDLDIVVTGFDFDQNGLGKEFRAAKGLTPHSSRYGNPMEGAVISHAGSGSIMDALRISVPLVVVPNTSLLHNHQEELAEELAKQEYVVHGKLKNIAAAIPEIENLRSRMLQWPPVNSGAKHEQGLAGVIDDEMGWVD
jgi:beta-1,4-N-acetylglucosaminyltransferase